LERALFRLVCPHRFDRHFNKAAVNFISIAVLMLVLQTGGCSLSKPRHRLGCYPTSTPGTRFISSDKLGQHGYGFSPFERNGITYTCDGGHIDITHLRIGADNTRYVTDKVYNCLMEGRSEFSFGLAGDKSKHLVKISYPENWGQSDKERIAREVSQQLGQYLAFTATTWHEMLTWYGYQTMAVFPEFASAFSWEDIYSNLLGTYLSVIAMRNTELDFNQAMTAALDKELIKLGGLSGRQARDAAEMMRGRWFKGSLLVTMKKRNLDIGLDDGYVTPITVPGFCKTDQVVLYPVPSSDVSRYGFSMDYEIFPREYEKKKLLRIVYPHRMGKTIKPAIHFAPIMARIKKSAVRKYGTEVDTPYEYGGSTYASSIPAYSPKTSAYAANDSVAYVNDSVNEYEPVETTIPSYEVYEPIEVTTTSSYEVYEPIEVTATSSYEVYEPVEVATTSSYEEYKPAGTITTSSYDEDGHLVAESEEINTLLASIRAKVSKI
jgi:Protein of unknown function (DUF4056)